MLQGWWTQEVEKKIEGVTVPVYATNSDSVRGDKPEKDRVLSAGASLPRHLFPLGFSTFGRQPRVSHSKASKNDANTRMPS